MKTVVRILGALGLFAGGYLFGTRGQTPAALAEQAAAQQGERVLELRTYTAPPGKLPELEKRFRDHTMYLFQKHGMKNIVYFVPTDTPQSRNTLIYLIAHDSRAEAERSWAAFRADTTWTRVARESQVDGPIVERVQSVFARATDFSPIR